MLDTEVLNNLRDADYVAKLNGGLFESEGVVRQFRADESVEIYGYLGPDYGNGIYQKVQALWCNKIIEQVFIDYPMQEFSWVPAKIVITPVDVDTVAFAIEAHIVGVKHDDNRIIHHLDVHLQYDAAGGYIVLNTQKSCAEFIDEYEGRVYFNLNTMPLHAVFNFAQFTGTQIFLGLPEIKRNWTYPTSLPPMPQEDDDEHYEEDAEDIPTYEDPKTKYYRERLDFNYPITSTSDVVLAAYKAKVDGVIPKKSGMICDDNSFLYGCNSLFSVFARLTQLVGGNDHLLSYLSLANPSFKHVLAEYMSQTMWGLEIPAPYIYKHLARALATLDWMYPEYFGNLISVFIMLHNSFGSVELLAKHKYHPSVVHLILKLYEKPIADIVRRRILNTITQEDLTAIVNPMQVPIWYYHQPEKNMHGQLKATLHLLNPIIFNDPRLMDYVNWNKVRSYKDFLQELDFFLRDITKPKTEIPVHFYAMFNQDTVIIPGTNLSIVVPDDTTTVDMWGQTQGHCIGTYGSAVLKGQQLLIGIMDMDTQSWVGHMQLHRKAAKVSDTDMSKVAFEKGQFYGKHNKMVESGVGDICIKYVMKLCNDWIEEQVRLIENG